MWIISLILRAKPWIILSFKTHLLTSDPKPNLKWWEAEREFVNSCNWKIQEYLASGMAGSRDLNHIPGSSLFPNLLIPLPISWYHVQTGCHGGRRAANPQGHILFRMKSSRKVSFPVPKVPISIMASHRFRWRFTCPSLKRSLWLQWCLCLPHTTLEGRVNEPS